MGRALESAGSRDRRRVLVIDDDEGLRDLVEALLRDEGFDVLAARDGEEGLRYAREWRPHVILCDLLMPRMNGFQFMLLYRATPPPHAAVIVSTAAGVSAKPEALALKPDDFLAKPFDLDELVFLIRRHAQLGAD